MNCSWVGEGQETANLTLLVDGEEQKGEEVTKEESGNGIVLTLDWSARNLTVGQGVVVSCTGQAGSVLISFGKWKVKTNFMFNWLQKGGMGLCVLSE